MICVVMWYKMVSMATSVRMQLLNMSSECFGYTAYDYLANIEG